MAEKGPKLKILPFDVTTSRLEAGRAWKRWIDRFERDLAYNGVDAAAKPQIAKAALLIYGGQELEDLHDTLPEATKPENMSDQVWGSTYVKSKTKLTNYFTPKSCNDFAIFELITTKIKGGETVSAYTLRLRELAKKCDFTNWSADKMIKALVISNMPDKDLRQKLLQKDRTLGEVLETAQKKEDAAARDKAISDRGGSTVNKLGASWPNKRTNAANSTGTDKPCPQCGYTKHSKDGKCPAESQACSKCKKKGHFAKMCYTGKNKQRQGINKVEQAPKYDSEDTDSDGEKPDPHNIKKITVKNVSEKTTLMKIMLNDSNTVWQPDTGTKKNLMTETHFKKYVNSTNQNIQLKPTNTQLYAYGSEDQLTVLGKFKGSFKAGSKEVKDTIYVTKEESEHPLISENTAIQLGLVTYNKQFIVNKTTSKKSMEAEENIKQEYPELFTGEIGKFNGGEIELMVNPDVRPVAQRPRRIPVNMAEKAEAKIKQLLNQDIIERYPENEPRGWISPVVFSPKPNGDIRACNDMREANFAIERPYTPLPTIEEVEAKFRGADTFSKLDLKEAYNQFVLSEKSRNITAFYGPDGLYRYKRLNYGTKSAQDIMQIELSKILADIHKQMNMADDIIIGGNKQEHDKALKEVCQALSDNGITLNPDKCIFNANQVTFMGLVFSKEGIRPDPKHIKNLREANPPANMSELRSFLGMSGYSMRFIQNFAQIAHPLRMLAKDNKWNWTDDCQKAFETLKESLSEHTLLCHYQPEYETEIVVDASLTGLGAVMVQRNQTSDPFHVVAYKSRALKDAETRYSTTEREALAIRWGVKKLRHLLLGAPKFKVITDHKPLTYMFNKTHGELPPRIERCVMDIQEFDYEVTHRPGKECIADFMSRKHSDRQGTSPVKVQESQTKNIVQSEICQAIHVESAITIKEVQQATAEWDLTMKIKKMISERPKSCKDPELSPYFRVIDELTIIDGMICKNKKILIPPSLQKRAIRLSHRMHQGISKTKAFARSFCWFPGIDQMIENKIRTCLQCQLVQDTTTEQPIKPRMLPEGPWQQVEMDFQGPYPNGQYIFVMMDRYARWPEIKVMTKAPNAEMTIKAMEEIFQRNGVPIICQSDNGSPFQSAEMTTYANQKGYEPVHVTPEWPRANGMVERFNRSMKEALQAANLEGENFTKAAHQFAEMYRATPHSATNISPFEAMHGGRKMKTILPVLNPACQIVDRQQDASYKQTLRKGNGGKKPHQLQVGDRVLARQKRENKMTTRFSPNQMIVTDVKGSSITASNEKKTMFRDGSLFRKLQENEDSEDEAAEEAEIPAPEEEIELEEHQDAPNLIIPVAPEANATNPGEGTDIVDSTSNTSRPRRTTAGQLPARLGDYEVQL